MVLDLTAKASDPAGSRLEGGEKSSHAPGEILECWPRDSVFCGKLKVLS